ncbi:MAG TPA: hypothetical protein VGO40_01620 [Longimicrobium sp.]|jgi:hypothetical protein|nr:hypothetical protein [Longimicrobium sp.]
MFVIASPARFRVIRVLPALALVALSAATCPRANPPGAQGSPPAAEVPAARGGVDGAWVHREMPVRYLESMTLATHGDAVTGEGTYMMEGGRRGKTTISGTWRGGVLTLYIVRDTGVREHWMGRLSGGALSGELSIDGDHRPFDFIRPE